MSRASEQTVERVQKLVADWARAELEMDGDALGRLLTDDFVGIGPAGYLLTKEKWEGRYRAGTLKQEAFALEDPAVRVYGDAAVVIGSQVQKTTYQGNDVSGTFRATLVAVRSGDEWRLAGLHLSPQAEGGPPSVGPR